MDIIEGKGLGVVGRYIDLLTDRLAALQERIFKRLFEAAEIEALSRNERIQYEAIAMDVAMEDADEDAGEGVMEDADEDAEEVVRGGEGRGEKGDLGLVGFGIFLIFTTLCEKG